MTGRTTAKKRTAIIHEFEADEPHPDHTGRHRCWILLMSGVGQTGLNITRATVGIFYVSPDFRLGDGNSDDRWAPLGSVLVGARGEPGDAPVRATRPNRGGDLVPDHRPRDHRRVDASPGTGQILPVGQLDEGGCRYALSSRISDRPTDLRHMTTDPLLNSAGDEEEIQGEDNDGTTHEDDAVIKRATFEDDFDDLTPPPSPPPPPSKQKKKPSKKGKEKAVSDDDEREAIDFAGIDDDDGDDDDDDMTRALAASKVTRTREERRRWLERTVSTSRIPSRGRN